MRKEFASLLALALLAGCTWIKKSDKALPNGEISKPMPLTYALPGVPLRSEMTAAAAEEEASTQEQPPSRPAPRPAQARPAPAAPAAPAAAVEAESTPAQISPEKELSFRLTAARKYSAAKKYRSAAAEYGASLKLIPAGDGRAVHVLERQGAMLLRAGDEPKAADFFREAIEKAAELKTGGNDLANAHLGLGYCLERAKKLPEAIANYEKARDLSASGAVKARIEKTISELKKAP